MTCFCKGQCAIATGALSLLQNNKPVEAYRLAKNLLIESPNCPRLHAAIGGAMLNTNRAVYAEYHFQRIKTIEGPHPQVMSNIGFCQIAQSKIDEAEGTFKTVLTSHPHFTRAIMGLAQVYNIKGMTKDAVQILEPAFKTNPNEINLRYTLAEMQSVDNSIGAILTLSSGHETGNDILLRGRIKEKQGDYDGAWFDYNEGNRICRENGLIYKPEGFDEIATKMYDFTTTIRMAQLTEIARETPFPETFQPFFITGYPRSGTTLLEQSLSLHSKIAGGDELPFVHEIVEGARSLIGTKNPYPICLAEFAVNDKRLALNMMRYYYLAKASTFATGKPMFTDKMPMNELHFPLIRLMFPDAPILYLQRHPLDVVVSNFSNFLTHGGNQSFDLEACASHFMLVYNLVCHYHGKTKAPVSPMLPIKYEDFVQNTEPTLKTVFEYSGLPFEKACLTPDKNGRYARTPSFSETRKPISDKSIGRYKNFIKYLDPVIEIVQFAVDNGGYGV